MPYRRILQTLYEHAKHTYSDPRWIQEDVAFMETVHADEGAIRLIIRGDSNRVIFSAELLDIADYTPEQRLDVVQQAMTYNGAVNSPFSLGIDEAHDMIVAARSVAIVPNDDQQTIEDCLQTRRSLIEYVSDEAINFSHRV